MTIKKKKKELLPELICLKEPHKNCNDGYYEVRIPIKFMAMGTRFTGMYQCYRFIGLKKEII